MKISKSKNKQFQEYYECISCRNKKIFILLDIGTKFCPYCKEEIKWVS